MSDTRILSCNCSHQDQDNRYGKGKRVHNRGGPKKQGTDQEWGCTSCGKRRGNQ